MPKCPECAKEWPEGQKFCGECGAPLETKPSKTRTAERRHAVVLFADIQGYTSLAAELDPEEISELMGPIYGLMKEAVEAHGGTVANFIGDAVMALFGTPVAHENDEARAIRCALELHRRMANYPEVHGRKLALTIGINAGLVVAGAISDAQKTDFDALGDTVNVAARLQDKADAGQVFVSERVYRRARPQFEWEPVGPFELKNIPRSVPAYNVVAERDPLEVAKFVGAGMAKLCGRDKEMQKIDKLLEIVIGGSGRVLGITGEAGVGKSRLVYELRNRAEDQGFRTLVGRTLSYGQNMPLLPVKEIIRLFAELKEHEETEFAQKRIREVFSFAWDDDEIREIRVTALAWFLGYPVDDSVIEKLEGKAKQSLLEVTLNEFFLSLASQAPLVLVLEDMQWSDPTTRDWAVQFARLIKDMPVLLVLAYRPGFEYDWSSEELITFNEISLAPIAAGAAGEMVSSILAIDEAPEELRNFVSEKSQGNPFFAEEIVKHLLEEKVIVRNPEDLSKVEIAKPLDKMDIPTSVQALLLSRVDRLEADTRRTLQEASVIGRNFLERILTEISSAKEKLVGHLSDLTGFELIYEQSRIPEILYVFKHLLARDAVYETLLKKERRKLHKAIAEAIEKLFPDRLKDFYSLLAHHYKSAGNTAKTVHYLHEEGKQLRDMGDVKSAYDVLTEARNTASEDHNEYACINLDLADVALDVESAKAAENLLQHLPDDLSPSEAARMQVTEGDIMYLSGMYAEAQEKYQSARSAAEAIGDADLLRKAIGGIGNTQFRIGDLEHAESNLRICLDLATRDNDTRAQGIASINIGNIYWQRRELQEALRFYERGLDLCRTYGHRQGEGLVLGNIAIVCEAMGNSSRALEYNKKSLELRLSIGDRHGVAMVLDSIGFWHISRGELDEALHYCEKSLQIHKKTGHRPGEAIVLGHIGNVYQKLGDLELALVFYERYLQASRRCNICGYEANALGIIAGVCLDMGNVQKALDYAEESFQLREKIGDHRGGATAIGTIGAILFEKGILDKAEELVTKAVGEALRVGIERMVAHLQLTLAEIQYERAKYDAGNKTLLSATAFFEKSAMNTELMFALLLAAEQALQRNEKEKAKNSLSKAESILPDTKSIPNVRNYYLISGRMLAALSKPDDAESAFTTALEHAVKCAEPTNHDLYRHYGRFLAETGQKEKAKEYLEKAKEIYEYRVAHGARRKELDEINSMLTELK